MFFISGEYTAEMGSNSVGTGRNKIKLRLGRGDLTSTYVCKAMNDALTEPITSSVQIDVNGEYKNTLETFFF